MQNNLLFFDDLIPHLLNLLKKRPEFLKLLSEKKQYIIIDEFQDINPIQIDLIKVLAGLKAELMVVGDPDQCIYKFRGATPDYMITGFLNDFSNCHDYYLSQTFRYGNSLAKVANTLISHNQFLKRKGSSSAKENFDTKINLIQTSKQEKAFLDLLATLKEKPENIAILVRLNSQIPKFETMLYKHKIPFIIDKTTSIFAQKPVMAMLAWLQAIVYGLDKQSSSQLLSYPHCGISENLYLEDNIIKILDKAWIECKDSFYKRQIRERKEIILNLKLRQKDLKSPSFLLSNLMRDLNILNQPLLNLFLDFIVKSNLNSKDLIKYCHDLKRQTLKEGILLTTMHKAKGLEWPVVILPDLYEKLIPYHQDDIKVTHLESERRLFYVAITRAKNKLYLLTSNDDDKLLKPQSRFLYEANLLL